MSQEDRRHAGHDAVGDERHPVVVVGAGPVGLTAAIDLALRGVPVLVLDAGTGAAVGSRAICFAKRTLEIWDRLGVGDRMVGRGITWQVGKVFFGEDLVFAFDLLPEPGHKRPAFVNLQQYHCERFLAERAAELPGLDLRHASTVTGVAPLADRVIVSVDGPDGPYRIEADYLVAADGARSAVRRFLGLDVAGRVFHDRFLIADVRMKAAFPTERWFWFDPPFNPGQSALLHRQPDDVWRIDLQLGWDADPEEERKPERVLPRLRAMLGDVEFELEWVSVYTFRCRRLARFRHGRVLFAGDAAHQVSPFGARGANGGVQDADNLAWKLALVVGGRAGEALLDSYDAERCPAADADILHSTRATDFITPKSTQSRAFRDAVLALAPVAPFARRFLNSGRLSTPAVLDGSPLSTPDDAPFSPDARPGSVLADAPLIGPDGPVWLLDRIADGFAGLWFVGPETDPGGAIAAALAALDRAPVPVVTLRVALPGGAGDYADAAGLAAARYDATPGTYYLIRPDRHVAARFREADAARIAAARDRAMAVAPARAVAA